MTTSPSVFYLFASATGKPDQSAATVFYKVEGESLAKSLCSLFTKEYSDARGCPVLFHASAAPMSPEEQVLLDETLDMLEVYDDPDPGIYDPPPSTEMHTLAQYGVRARTCEDLLREKTASKKPAAGPTRANGEGAEQALVIALAKTKHVLMELTGRAHTEVAKTLSNFNLHGTLFSSKCLLAVGKVAEVTAKELIEKVTAIYVDTVGSDLPKDTAVTSITKAVDEFYAEFKSKHQSRFTGLMGTGAQILGKLDEKIAALKAGIPEKVDIALFDAKKHAAAAGSSSVDGGEVSEEEAEEALRYIVETYKEFTGRYHVFPLVRRLTGRALLRLVEAGDAILRDYPETLDPKQSEVVAWLLDYLVEYADYHDLLDMSQRLNHEAEVTQKLDELKTAGLGVFAGGYPAMQVFENGKSLKLQITVILVASLKDTRIKRENDGTEFIQGAIPKRKKESGESKGPSTTTAENAAGTKDDMHRVAVGVEALGTELRELRKAMAAVQNETTPQVAKRETAIPTVTGDSEALDKIKKHTELIPAILQKIDDTPLCTAALLKGTIRQKLGTFGNVVEADFSASAHFTNLAWRDRKYVIRQTAAVIIETLYIAQKSFGLPGLHQEEVFAQVYTADKKKWPSGNVRIHNFFRKGDAKRLWDDGLIGHDGKGNFHLNIKIHT